ncbi:MAG: hypothetical protein LBF22_12265 [Deltaproteobacteria bacterium]|jgi:hypothetical protein|nr:hypothetical protein [Deltaproteobacteria bacterium]
MPYIYSGFCLAAMFGSILYEHHLIKKEEKELCERMRILAENTRNSLDKTGNPIYALKPSTDTPVKWV